MNRQLRSGNASLIGAASTEELEKRLEQVELQLKIIRQLDERRDKIMANLHTALEQSNVAIRVLGDRQDWSDRG